MHYEFDTLVVKRRYLRNLKQGDYFVKADIAENLMYGTAKTRPPVYMVMGPLLTPRENPDKTFSQVFAVDTKAFHDFDDGTEVVQVYPQVTQRFAFFPART